MWSRIITQFSITSGSNWVPHATEVMPWKVFSCASFWILARSVGTSFTRMPTCRSWPATASAISVSLRKTPEEMDHVVSRALGIPGLGQELLGLRGIVGERLHARVVAEPRGREGPAITMPRLPSTFLTMASLLTARFAASRTFRLSKGAALTLNG